MINIRLIQTERVCSWQFQLWQKWQKVFQKGRKCCGKRRNCSLRAISPFPTTFSKDLVLQTSKSQVLFGKGLRLWMKCLLYRAVCLPCMFTLFNNVEPLRNASCQRLYFQPLTRQILFRYAHLKKFSRWQYKWVSKCGIFSLKEEKKRWKRRKCQLPVLLPHFQKCWSKVLLFPLFQSLSSPKASKSKS